MPPKENNPLLVKEFKPWYFLLGGLFSLGVIYGTLNARIEKSESFEKESKVIHVDLDEKSIGRHEKSLEYTNEKFKELREVIRLHGTKTDNMHIEVIKLTTTLEITRDDVKSIKNLLIEMNKNKLIEMNKKNKGH